MSSAASTDRQAALGVVQRRRRRARRPSAPWRAGTRRGPRAPGPRCAARAQWYADAWAQRSSPSASSAGRPPLAVEQIPRRPVGVDGETSDAAPAVVLGQPSVLARTRTGSGSPVSSNVFIAVEHPHPSGSASLADVSGLRPRSRCTAVTRRQSVTCRRRASTRRGSVAPRPTPRRTAPPRHHQPMRRVDLLDHRRRPRRGRRP